MTLSQILFGGFLVLVLLALAGFTGWSQWHMLRASYAAAPMAEEDRTYYRNQARRRLAGSLLMIVLAGLMIGSFFLEGPAQALADKQQASRDRGEGSHLTPDEHNFRVLYLVFWSSALAVLMVLLVLAGADYIAIRHYGRRQFRQLQEERRAMIAEELQRFRRERSERN